MLATLLVGLLPVAPPDQTDQIVSKIRNVYATCKTYVDTGTSESVYMEEPGVKQTDKLTFRTAFERPGKLRFEFTEYNEPRKKMVTCIIWANGKRDPNKGWLANAFYGYDDKTETDEELGLSIAGFTGISAGTAHTIGHLLFPKEVGGLDYLERGQVKLEKTEVWNKRTYYVLRNKEAGAVLWFDSKTFLLTKIEEKLMGTQTTIYKPAINVPVKATEFTGPKK